MAHEKIKKLLWKCDHQFYTYSRQQDIPKKWPSLAYIQTFQSALKPISVGRNNNPSFPQLLHLDTPVSTLLALTPTIYTPPKIQPSQGWEGTAILIKSCIRHEKVPNLTAGSSDFPPINVHKRGLAIVSIYILTDGLSKLMWKWFNL